MKDEVNFYFYPVESKVRSLRFFFTKFQIILVQKGINETIQLVKSINFCETILQTFIKQKDAYEQVYENL